MTPPSVPSDPIWPSGGPEDGDGATYLPGERVTMELAIQVMKGYSDTLELARWAEAENLAGLAVADHYLPGVGQNTYALDQLSVLAAVAAGTSDLKLSSLVSPITFRHPAVMLKTAVTIDEISGGRFSLGIGAGWLQEEHDRFGLELPPVGERFDRLTEALDYVRAGLAGGESGFEGRYYTLEGGNRLEPTGHNVRLIVGGGGSRRTPTLAGEKADEFNVFPAREPYGPRIQRALEAAASAGRDPKELTVSTAFPLVVASAPTDVERRLKEVAASRGTTAEVVRTTWSEIGIPMGTPDEYRAGLERLEALGVKRVYFQMSFDTVDQIKRSIELLRGA
jgi:alkanesulfonate monooxygenase SsuD/methylene tetrahydromethanopterin reductase-like flavin-dependent oxidoreductase (luciferase family)